jgi:hypothetical protein
LKRLVSSNPLKAYAPDGDPGLIPCGVRAEVVALVATLDCAWVRELSMKITIMLVTNRSKETRVDWCGRLIAFKVSSFVKSCWD